MLSTSAVLAADCPATPAHRAATNFLRGANLGNYLEAPRGQDWGARYTVADFAHLQREGFDHVRIPVAWHHYAAAAPEFTLSPEIFQRVDFLVTNALQHKLKVIVNLHHFDAFTSDPASHTNQFYALWRQLARHYCGFSADVAFELLNEPKDQATTRAMNPIYAEAIRAIRPSNPTRTLFVGPGRWNQARELEFLALPVEDQNLIVTIHCYDPFYFTHQGASWAGPDVKVTGIIFPGPPPKPLVIPADTKVAPQVHDWIARYNSLRGAENPSSLKPFRQSMLIAAEWSRRHCRPIHVGEFGAYARVDPASRARFYAGARGIVEELGWGWAIWDWKAGFRYWNDKAGQPMPGMREALFPRKPAQ